MALLAIRRPQPPCLYIRPKPNAPRLRSLFLLPIPPFLPRRYPPVEVAFQQPDELRVSVGLGLPTLPPQVHQPWVPIRFPKPGRPVGQSPLQRCGWTHEKILLREAAMIGRARPAIVLGPRYDPGPHGIALHVTHGRPEVSRLNHRRVAPPVPQLSANPVAPVERSCIADQRTRHRVGDRFPILGNGDHVDVVSHERIRPDFETGLPGRRAHNVEEPQPVGGVQENGLV